MSRQIALLTDFGLRDNYVGVMKAVILARAPRVQLIDLCHEVPPQDIRRAAFLLATSVPYFSPGTIFLVVVDPGVGTSRRPVAIEIGDWAFVGPDNGICAWFLRLHTRDGHICVEPAAGRLRLKSGARAVQLTNRRHWRPDVSSTFHGRDIFAPVAAELSLGRPLTDVGASLNELIDLPWPEPVRTAHDIVQGEVLTIDGYGNLVTNLRAEDLPSSPKFEIGGHAVSGLSQHFQSDAALVAVLGSSGFVELAAPSASASRLLGAAPGMTVSVTGVHTPRKELNRC